VTPTEIKGNYYLALLEKKIMPDNKNTFDLESTYDKEVAPLMAKLIDICKKHKLPMFATFLYANNPQEDGAGYCTTQLLFEERPIPKEMFKLNPMIRGNRGEVLRMRVTKGDGSVEDIVILP
jgi:hypothetical protein